MRRLGERRVTFALWTFTIIAALALLFFSAPQRAYANTTTVDGVDYEYEVTSGIATITHCGGEIGATLEIPAKLDSYPVDAIRGVEVVKEQDGWYGSYYTHYYYSVFWDASSNTNTAANLKNLILPTSLTVIDKAAFAGCENLERVSIPSAVTEIKDHAFASCPQLNSVSLPDSLVKIGDSAFMNCAGLCSISLGKQVTTIGSRVFEECISLIAINLPNSIKEIGSRAFYHCQSLVDIVLPNQLTSIESFARVDEDGTTYYGMFQGCSSLQNIVIPSSITQIGSRAFSGCSSLKNIELPKSLTALGNSVFAGCTSLKAITIPSTVKSMGRGVFFNCSNLASVILPNIKISLGSDREYPRIGGMFEGCSSLQHIELPASIEDLGEEAFFRCTKLAEVNIPQGVTAIGYSAFRGCSNLRRIFIPKTVESIGVNAFAECSSLTDVYYDGNTTMLQLLSVGSGNSALRGAHFIFGATGLPAQGDGTARPINPIEPSAPNSKPTATTPVARSITQAAVTIGSKAYTGKVITPTSIKVKLGNKTLRKGIDYTVACKGGKAVGSYRVTIVGRGAYMGSKTSVFKIVPKGVSISKVVKNKRAFTVKWKKPSKTYRKQITGYQVRYSKAKSMKGAKIMTVKGPSKTACKIKNLKGGKKYYIQVRAYKKTGSKTYYSSWSKTKSATTKK